MSGTHALMRVRARTWDDIATRRWFALALAPTGALGLWLLRGFDPSSPHSMFPPCVFHLLTGLHCPGCGLTRALHALAHGDIARAWAMHPLLLLALPAVVAMIGQWLWGRTVLPAWANRWLHDGRVWIALLLLFGVLRNLPWAGVAWMAPG